MARYLLRRVLHAAGLLVALSMAVFGLIYLSPADPARVIAAQRLGDAPTPEQVAEVAALYGLDQPLAVQYVRWLARTLVGDLGFSLRTGELVRHEMAAAINVSLRLGLATLAWVLVVGTGVGIGAALQRNRLWDHLARGGALVAVSIPEFWLAFLLILVFAVHLGWLPSFGARSWQHFILPMVTLGLGQAARLSRLTRSMLLEQLRQDYLRTVRAKGLPTHIALLRHALPNMAIPYITVVAFQFASLISGTVIIETLFSLPGLGSAYAIAVSYRDLPMIQSVVLLFAALIVLTNLLADVSYGFFDPRVQLG